MTTRTRSAIASWTLAALGLLPLGTAVTVLAADPGAPGTAATSPPAAATPGAASTQSAPPVWVEIRPRALTRSGARRTSDWATKPPIDQPTTGIGPASSE